MLRPSPPTPPPPGRERRSMWPAQKGKKMLQRFLGKHREKRIFGRYWNRWKNYIKVRDHTEIEFRMCV